MDRRRRGLLIGCIGLLAAPRLSIAQEPGKMARIAYVVPSAAECAPTHASEAFHQSLKDYGYVSGQNVVWDRRCFQNDNQVTELIAELVRPGPRRDRRRWRSSGAGRESRHGDDPDCFRRSRGSHRDRIGQ